MALRIVTNLRMQAVSQTCFGLPLRGEGGQIAALAALFLAKKRASHQGICDPCGEVSAPACSCCRQQSAQYCIQPETAVLGLSRDIQR